jgi:hypothetical protein
MTEQQKYIVQGPSPQIHTDSIDLALPILRIWYAELYTARQERKGDIQLQL